MANITGYKYSYHSKSGTSRASIQLLNGALPVGYIDFVPDGEPIPDPYVRYRAVFMVLPKSDLVGVVDMLRNESPIFCSIDSTGNARISTYLEEAGEGET
ncbi:MAG: hypothetical protein JKY87_03935 [Mariprofundus sp.]|nr:hypothetical protein [Mariprofundus sp.]